MDAYKELDRIRADFDAETASCADIAALEEIRTKYVGRKGALTGILRSISSLSPEDKKKIGSAANAMKSEFTASIEGMKDKFVSKGLEEKSQSVDITMPGISGRTGFLHPITQTMDRISEIFVSLGFSIADGPEIETEFYNFEALNIPLEHPSRDGFDTFYVGGKHLLRSHTSNVQIHLMQGKKPPIQAIMPGRVYRPDAVDATHSFMFHQVEGLMVDKGIAFSDLKGVLEAFCKSMFGDAIKMRMRPSFFPFTEPSTEVDISCIMCGGKGCRICSSSGWLEVLGAGMVNPKVFKAVGYDPSEVTGFAFGIGAERIAMLLYGIDDIRLFFENDIRFLEQFR
ncbi:MAG: phenylalanine--tRNA ligase subunit alpha [Candidatus Omnitrophica bacterium]|nr:phenylalanine--tRNA ligase subunit alpha [Candidatus Omnitrophota bacterium]MDD5488318.1 phenylalanine--tRNA ligase subunit alpha [Candidatus Omnitrophota bacterium]